MLALAVGLGFSEWLRCVVLTGFPWNELGMALGANLELAQIASIVGLHGLTLAGGGDLRRAGDAMDRDAATLAADRARGARARRDLRLRRLAR